MKVGIGALTARQRDILRIDLKGEKTSNHAIALALGVGLRTIEADRQTIKRKLDTADIVQGALWSFPEGKAACDTLSRYLDAMNAGDAARQCSSSARTAMVRGVNVAIGTIDSPVLREMARAALSDLVDDGPAESTECETCGRVLPVGSSTCPACSRGGAT